MAAHPDDVERHLRAARKRREAAEVARDSAMAETVEWIAIGGDVRVPVTKLADWSGLTRRTVYRYLPEQEDTVSGVTMPEWTPDEPDNSKVISALTDAGVDPGSIWASPDRTWHVGEGDDSIAIGPSYDDSMNETWDASRGDELIESGDLATVATAVAAAMETEENQP